MSQEIWFIEEILLIFRRGHALVGVGMLPVYHVHMLCVLSLQFEVIKIADYVHEYYSVSKFKKAYDKAVKPMTDKKQWPQVNPGFKLWPPILKRVAGRPRVRRYKSAAKGGNGMRTTRCKRCKHLGHMEKTCNETHHHLSSKAKEKDS